MYWEQNPKRQSENVKLVFSKDNVHVYLEKVSKRLQDQKGCDPCEKDLAEILAGASNKFYRQRSTAKMLKKI